MEPRNFDHLTRTIGLPAGRRSVLRAAGSGLLASALAVAGLGTAPKPVAAAACKGKGKACKRGGQCCSGVCKGKTCRDAPQQGTCTIKKDTCKLTGGIGFGPSCNGVDDCECIRTKTGAAFCRQKNAVACTSCVGDFTCEAAFGPNAKCIKGDTCGDPCGIGDFCAVPCGFDPV